MQRDISEEDYEIIVVDNGSTESLDEDSLSKIAPNVRFERASRPSVSPVGAINQGLQLARGDVIGVCIDGARMASPGLVASALAASKCHQRPVIGTLAFHLGPELQMESMLKGYNQQVEDDLLKRVDWESDGYRLFRISVFAASSGQGWFVTPAESNAFFLRAEHWRELGGFDEGFQTRGGGLANLDLWKRACEDPSTELIMLLGEATFHQIHGGVATNSRASPWQEFHEEYLRLRKEPYAAPLRIPYVFGTINPMILPSLPPSVEALFRGWQRS